MRPFGRVSILHLMKRSPTSKLRARSDAKVTIFFTICSLVLPGPFKPTVVKERAGVMSDPERSDERTSALKLFALSFL